MFQAWCRVLTPAQASHPRTLRSRKKEITRTRRSRKGPTPIGSLSSRRVPVRAARDLPRLVLPGRMLPLRRDRVQLLHLLLLACWSTDHSGSCCLFMLFNFWNSRLAPVTRYWWGTLHTDGPKHSTVASVTVIHYLSSGWFYICRSVIMAIVNFSCLWTNVNISVC